MEQITVTKVSGSTLDLMRLSPPINFTDASQNVTLMGDDLVSLSFESAEILDLDIGDKITVFGEEYKLNQLPNIKKNGKRWFDYNCVFEGSQYDLLRVQFLNADVVGGSTGTSFDITGDCYDITTILINNLNRIFPAKWILTGYPLTEVRTMQFSEENCLQALIKICEEFEYEFKITQGSSGMRYLNILKSGTILPYQYQYGIGNGLYEISRQSVENRNLVTRLYAYGSDKNLPSNYRNYSQRLRFNDTGYIEKESAITSYGVIEKTIVFDEIYPKRTGTVTSNEPVNKKIFYDNTMFDLNETDSNGTKWLIAGTPAKVSFLTGNLAGYEFTIASYNHGEKKFTINEYKDDRGETFPSPTITAFQIEIGDTYTLLDIRLPDNYITDAENELKAKAQDHLEVNSVPAVQYLVSLDEFYLQNGQQVEGTPVSVLPDGWVHTNIGDEVNGFSQYANGFKMIGGSDSETGLSFLHRGIAVDGNSLSSTLYLEPKLFGSSNDVPVTAQYGLMVRFGLNTDSKFVAIKIENGFYRVIYRSTVGGAISISGDLFAFESNQRFGIYVEFNGSEQKTELIKFLSNKFRNVFNYIFYNLTAPEIAAVRIGYFLANTDGLRAVLKLDTVGNTETVPEIPVTDLGDYNYININNGNIGTGAYVNGVYTIINAGLDVWGTDDKFGFLFFELDDSTAKIRANLIQQPKYLGTNTDLSSFARCGLMWRAENVTGSDCIGIAQNQNGTIFVFERYDNDSINILGSQITDKTSIHDFWISVNAGSPGVSTRYLTIRVGYIENGQEVQVRSISHIISNTTYAASKLGVFQSSFDAVQQAVLNATIIIGDVAPSDNPCGKPLSGNIFSDICMYQWGEEVYT